MQDHPAGSDGSARGRPGRLEAGRVDHKVAGSGFRTTAGRGIEHPEVARVGDPAPAFGVGVGDPDLGRPPRRQDRRRADADGPAPQDETSGRGQGRQENLLGQPHRMPAAGDRLGQARRRPGHVIGDGHQVAFRYCHERGEGALAGRHGDDLARRAKVGAPGQAGGAPAAGDQRIDRHPAARLRSPNHNARSLVSQDQRGGPAVVMAEIGVHVRPADADRLDLHQHLAGAQDGGRHVADFERFGTGVDQRLHLAVNPPSTNRTWPVT